MVAAGFPVVATTSGGVAAALGYEDHEGAPADEMLAAAARIARGVDVPVTVDAEAGYGMEPADLVAELRSMGAAGCNLEDSDYAAGSLRDPDRHAEWLRAVRQAASEDGYPLVINARIDVFLGPFLAGADPGTQDELVPEALRRAKLKRPILLIAGDGEARRDVRRAFADVPCRAEFLGKIAPDELAPLYAAADLLVWPAINEAFGMALLEAQACGLPVLAGAFGGVAGIVADGKTGFLTRPGDVKDFAAGLKRALASDLPALGRAARRKVERRHDIAAAAATFARALARLGVKL